MYQKNKYLAFFSLLIILASFPSFGFDRSFGYHPDSSLALGKGVSPHRPLTEHLRCLKVTSEKAIDSSGAVSARFNMSLVRDSKDLLSKLKISPSLTAHAKFGEIGGQLSIESTFERNINFHEDSLVLLIKGEADYGRHEIVDYDLKEQFQKLLTDGKYDDFRRICGSHFVIRQRRASVVSAIIQVSNLSVKDRIDLSLSLSIGTTGEDLPQGGEAKTSFESFIDQSSKKGKVNISFFALGGSGIKDLAPFSGQLGGKEGVSDLAAIKEGLEEYMESVTPEAAPPVKYYLAPMSLFGLEASTESIDPLRSETLVEVYYETVKTQSEVERLNRAILDFPEHSHRDSLVKWATQRGAYLRALWKSGEDCASSRPCQMPDASKLEIIDWQAVKETKAPSDNSSSVNSPTKGLTPLHVALLEMNCYGFAPCGKRRNWIGLAPNWQAAVVARGYVGDMAKVRSFSFYRLDKNGEKKYLPSYSIKKKNDSQNPGFFAFAVEDFTRDRSPEVYREVMKKRPIYFLEITDISGTVSLYNLGQFKVNGRHEY